MLEYIYRGHYNNNKAANDLVHEDDKNGNIERAILLIGLHVLADKYGVHSWAGDAETHLKEILANARNNDTLCMLAVAMSEHCATDLPVDSAAGKRIANFVVNQQKVFVATGHLQRKFNAYTVFAAETLQTLDGITVSGSTYLLLHFRIDKQQR